MSDSFAAEAAGLQGDRMEMSSVPVRISVVIPVYNTKKYLRRCMESIIHQTYRNLEIICVDDGSTDDSGELLDAYAAKDQRITVLHKANGGLVSARKAGVARATGEYISYVDSDDEISLTRYEELLETGIAQHADIIFTDVANIYGDGSRQDLENYFEDRLYQRDEIVRVVMANLCSLQHFYYYKLRLSVCEALFQRELLQACQPLVSDDIAWGEDSACMMACLLHADKICFARAGKYYYHKNGDSMTHALEESEVERKRVWRSNHALYLHYQKLLPGFPEETRSIVVKELALNVYYTSLLFDYARVVEQLSETGVVFPFGIRSDCRVVIYGAGTFGVQIYRYLMRHGGNVVLWCDRAWERFRVQGYEVSSPEAIRQMEYDYVLMAIAHYEVAEKAARALVALGIPADTIRFMDIRELTSERLNRIYES